MVEQERAGTSWAPLQQCPRLASAPWTLCPCPSATTSISFHALKKCYLSKTLSRCLSHEAPRSRGFFMAVTVSQDTVGLLQSVQGGTGDAEESRPSG